VCDLLRARVTAEKDLVVLNENLTPDLTFIENLDTPCIKK
jgi:hypothetical protein